MDFRELKRIADAEERRRKQIGRALRSVEELLEERARRDPQISIVRKGSLEEVKIPLDEEAWKTAILSYHLADEAGMLRDVLEGGHNYAHAERTEDGARTSAGSPIEPTAEVLLRFRKRYAEDFQGKKPIFVDMGSYDGRVVALAHLLGYKAFGIELSLQGHRNGRESLTRLERDIPSLKEVRIVQGDYTTTRAFRDLGIKPKDVAVFYNYNDGNVDKVAAVMVQKGSPGAKLLVQSYMETIDDVRPLRLVEMIETPASEVPIFDVFVRDK